MRQGQQHRRGRGRNNNVGHHGSNNNNRKGQNPLTRSFESNGPDVKVRGTPAHVAEKYLQLARDAQSSGDHVLAENYLQHAEHYNRIILAFREQQQAQQQSGDGMNGGGGRHHSGPRHDMHDGDDHGGGEAMSADDDLQGGDNFGFGRGPSGDTLGSGDVQPSVHEEPRISRHGGEHQPRFRDRHQRQDRPDRNRGDRGEGGFERQERQERFGDRGFDRQRERQPEQRQPERQSVERSEVDQQSAAEPRELREPREPRELREPREMRERREPREMRPRQPRPMTPEADGTPVPENGTAPHAQSRVDGGTRRRERFELSADQPEFLRRPVRRPRREAEAEMAPEPPPVDDTPRE